MSAHACFAFRVINVQRTPRQPAIVCHLHRETGAENIRQSKMERFAGRRLDRFVLIDFARENIFESREPEPVVYTKAEDAQRRRAELNGDS